MRTIFFKNKPKIIGAYSVAGPKESQGGLKDYIHHKLTDDMFGETTFEKAETKMLYTALKGACTDANVKISDINSLIAGDLLNQIIAATFSARSLETGYLGVYNACSTFTESLLLGATLIDGGYFKNVLCGTSSHFSSAERQYRYPLELGSTRTPLSQWTVTGAGACVLSNDGDAPKITSATVGKVVDYGVTDVNNMGAAMAPAAADTLFTHLNETGLKHFDYDLIITGDLGAFGSRVFKDLCWEKGIDVEGQHVDCGEIIFNICEDEYQGGSGAGCSSVVFSSYFYPLLKSKKLSKVLLIATGALLSAVSSAQSESIPSIAHAVSMEC